jgi:flagellar biosynthesis/type III secretory pathway chaperone
MISDLNDLAAVLEEEIAVGEELRRNLACQRQALVDWDMEALIAAIEAREIRLRSLGALEQRRLEVLKKDGVTDTSIELKRLISQSPEGLPGRQRLCSVRTRALETFSRLQADELSVNGLMEDLLAHLREALTPLALPAVSLYGDKGGAAPQRPKSAFIHNKA